MQLHRSTALLAALAVLALLPAPTGAASGDEDLSGSGSGSELAPTPSPSTPAVTLTTTTTVPAVTVATVTTETTVTNTTATTVTTTTAITITTQTTTTSSTTTSSTTVSTTTTVSATCHAGHFLNTTANKCEPCPDNTYQDEDEDHTLTVCMPWVKCEPGQKVATPPTAVSQVTCYAAPSGVTKENPLGQPGTICGPTQFVDSVVPDDGGSASGFGSNLIDDAPVVCAYQEKCPKGFAVFLAASPTSQVECTDCKLKGEFYSDEQNAPFCKPWSTCPKDTKWKQPSGSATQDIDCVACEAGLWQPMENSRSTKCQHTTTPAPTTPTIPVDGSGSGSDNAMPDTTTAKGGLSLMILIAICAGGTILLLGLGLVVKRSCRRKASYLTANEWSDSGRSWRGDYNDDADDETLLGGL